MMLSQQQGCDSHRDLSRSRRGRGDQSQCAKVCSASEVIPCPDPQGWSKHSTEDEEDVSLRERKSLPRGEGHTFLGEIPSKRNNSPEKENNPQLFSGPAEGAQ